MANELNERLLRTPSSTTSAIAARLLSVLLIGSVSIWAQYEASRGFDITIVNDAHGTPSARRFDLLFVSNDKATRIILNTSNFVEQILYPGSDTHEEVVLPKKPVDRVMLRLVQMSSTSDRVSVDVSPGKKAGEFVIGINSAIMEEKNPNEAMVAAVQRGMARVWLWEGRKGAPRSLLEGMVEYIANLAGISPSPESARLMRHGSGGCWTEDDPTAVAQFLRFCEANRRGFFARLNHAMREDWQPRMMDESAGIPVRRLCSSYHSVINATLSASANTTSDLVGEEILNQDHRHISSSSPLFSVQRLDSHGRLLRDAAGVS